MWRMSGRDADFGSSPRSDPHLCQEEEKAISSLLALPARPGGFPFRPSRSQPPVPQPPGSRRSSRVTVSLSSGLSLSLSLSLSPSFRHTQSEPKALGCTARLPPAGSGPGEA
ncbi:unnamed protein product [Ophioblennius macclurei]